MKVVVSIIGVLVLAIGAYILLSKSETNNIAFIDTYEVFNEYHFKKQQDSVLKEFEQQLTQRLDSISNEINTLRSEIQGSNSQELFMVYNQKVELYKAAQGEANELINDKSNQLTALVYDSLNISITRYSQKNGVNLLLGANGQGTVMYIDSTKNLTKEIIGFINQ